MVLPLQSLTREDYVCYAVRVAGHSCKQLSARPNARGLCVLQPYHSAAEALMGALLAGQRRKNERAADDCPRALLQAP